MCWFCCCLEFFVFIFVCCTFLLCFIFGSCCCWYFYCHHHHRRLPDTYMQTFRCAYTFLTVLAKIKFSLKAILIKPKCNQEFTLVRFVTLWWNRYQPSQIINIRIVNSDRIVGITNLYGYAWASVFDLNFDFILVLNRCVCARVRVPIEYLHLGILMLKFSIIIYVVSIQ